MEIRLEITYTNSDEAEKMKTPTDGVPIETEIELMGNIIKGKLYLDSRESRINDAGGWYNGYTIKDMYYFLGELKEENAGCEKKMSDELSFKGIADKYEIPEDEIEYLFQLLDTKDYFTFKRQFSYLTLLVRGGRQLDFTCDLFQYITEAYHSRFRKMVLEA